MGIQQVAISNPMLAIRQSSKTTNTVPMAVARAAAAAMASGVKDEFGSAMSLSDLCEAVWRAYPRGAIPLGTATGDMQIWEQFPASDCPMPYDPLKAMLLNARPSNQHFFAHGTESSGSINYTITADAGTATDIAVVKLEFDTNPDGSGTKESKTTLTFAPVELNSDLIVGHEDATSGVTTYTSQTETNSFKFQLPKLGEGTVWWHLARRPSARPNVTWTRALLATPVASGTHPTTTIVTDVANLVTGCLVDVSTTVVTADSADFPAYARLMLERYYTGY